MASPEKPPPGISTVKWRFPEVHPEGRKYVLIAAIIAAASLFVWDFLTWPLIVLTKSSNYTLPVGVASLQGEFQTDYGIIFAGAAIAALPIIIFFLIFQRYFLEGVRMGAVKG